MNHTGTNPITTPRLLLRPFQPQDAEPMFRNWASDPEVTKFLTWPSHTSLEVSRYVLDSWCASYHEPEYYQWAIVLKELDEPIGAISVVKVNNTLSAADIGYCIGKAWWNTGIMTEALKTVIDYLFREVGFNRIAACHDTNNPASGRVMQKAGMKYEGTLRASDHNNQGIVDAAWYSILCEEYLQK